MGRALEIRGDLSAAELALLSARICRGPDPEADGSSSWTLPDLCCWIEDRFAKRLPPRSLSRILRRERFSRQKTRPNPPGNRRSRTATLRKRGLPSALEDAANGHPGKRITLWSQDERRVGQKGRLCHRCWTRGKRPPGVQDQRHAWACLFGAARPGGEAAFVLVLPTVNTDTIQVFLDRCAETLAKDEHAVMVLDRAGRHGAKALRVPPNVTLAPLPPYSPQLKPMERVWLHPRERFLSLHLLEGSNAIVDACCTAWNAIADDADRIRPLCLDPSIEKLIG